MRSPIAVGVVALLALGSYSSCVLSGEREARYGEDLSMELEFPLAADKSQDETVVEPVVWRWMGEATFADKGAVDPDTAWHRYLETSYFEDDEDLEKSRDENTDRSAAASADTGAEAQRWIAVHLESGFEYEIELDSSFGRKLHAHLHQAGLDAASKGESDGLDANDDELREAGDDVIAKGWSNGDDTRTRRFNNKSYPYRAMGQLGGGPTSGCSGTLIGRRHILTAAHCLYDTGSDSWVSQAGTRFRPGREGTCNNIVCEPYGEYNARWYFTPAEFRQVDNNWTYDYGIMVTWGYPGDLTGWMGYAAANTSTTRDYCDIVPFGPGYLGGTCFNRGYPACGLSGAPANCKQGWAYQDVNPCEIGSFGSKGPDNWWSRVTVNCDSSGGHSGSALFTNAWNGSGKVVFGVASTHSCSTCGAGDDFPNAYRRVTPDVLGWISYFKTVKFP